MAEFKKYGEMPGIQIISSFWDKTFNGTYACPLQDMVPLSYISYDETPNFNDFVPFGMWKTPNKKKYHFT